MNSNANTESAARDEARDAAAWASAAEADAARDCAVWPEATDEELSAEPEVLKAALLARLPGLLAAFRADVEGFGFMWEVQS